MKRINAKKKEIDALIEQEEKEAEEHRARESRHAHLDDRVAAAAVRKFGRWARVHQVGGQQHSCQDTIVPKVRAADKEHGHVKADGTSSKELPDRPVPT